VKLGLVMVTGVSLVRVASAYQARMDRQGELAAVLQIENVQLTKAQQRFDRLFLISGEKTLAREQSQWIAPNRLRVVWQAPAAPTKAPAAPAKASATPSKASSAPSKAAENAPDPAPQRAPGGAPYRDGWAGSARRFGGELNIQPGLAQVRCHGPLFRPSLLPHAPDLR